MKNLVAQITPSVKVSKPSQNIFDNPTIVEADYMLALARPYGLGAEEVRFEIVFGTLEVKEDAKRFVNLISQNITLTKDELASWGTDDEACYNVIAGKLGIQAVSFDTVITQGY